MKRNIRMLLISLIIANLWTSCIGGTFISNNVGYKKVEACEGIKDYSREYKINEIKSLLNSIPQLVRKNDEQYILDREKNYNCEYEFKIDDFYKHDSDIIKSLKSTWNIEDDDYLAVVGMDKKQNLETMVQADLITYFIGLNTGNIIIIPPQGGMEVYVIKDNDIIKTYNDITQSSSYKWR